MKIALDVDGVLADVIKSWLDYNNNRRKIITKNEITEWDFWKKFDIKPDQFDDELSLCWKSWENIPPTENNLSNAVYKLTNLGTVDIVTARERSTNTYVKNWLKTYNIHYHQYVSVENGQKKAELDYDVYIDDSPINAEKIVNVRKNVLLYSQPWNLTINDSRVKRIKKLMDAVQIIKDQKFLFEN
jgi:hypothetical protein